MPAPTPASIFGPNYVHTPASDTITFRYGTNAGANGGVAANDWPETNATVADATTGDARAVVYGFLEHLSEWYESLSPAARPVNMKIVRSGVLTDVAGVATVTRTYSVTFKADPGAMNLLPEA